MAKRTKNVRSQGEQTRKGYISAEVETAGVQDYVVVELRYESPVAFTASKFAAPAAAGSQADMLNRTLERYDIQTLRSHFGLSSATVRERVEVAATLPSEPEPSKFRNKGMDTAFIQSGFVQVVPKNERDAAKIAREMNQKSAVWKAFVAPRPKPAAVLNGASAGSRNFEPAQGYLHATPNGIGAMEVWGLAGAKGKGITICDIEGNWNRSHEDLPKGIPLLGGTLIDDIGWRNHGTAVLGEMISEPGQKGTVGISHQAKGAVQSAVIGGVFNTAGAIINAADHLKAGDVILIELQGVGPNGKYVAMQYWGRRLLGDRRRHQQGHHSRRGSRQRQRELRPRDFQRHGAAEGQRRDRGGRRDPADEPLRHRQRLPGHRRAALAHLVLELREDRERAGLGLARDDARVWGRAGGGSENRWYTLRFSGTSSASPIVTGAVACLQGRAKAKNGSPMTPAKVRKILMATGTPQQGGPGVPLTQNIGPQPNLPKAMGLV
jgi:hypothetical protein